MASDRLWGDREEKKVILDSSAIMMLFEFSIDLEEELTRLLGKHYIVIPIPIIKELEFLSKHGKGNKKIIAKSSLKLVEKYDVMEIEEEGDNAVFCLAKKHGCVVVTNDGELRKRLKKVSVPVVFLRGKQMLCLE